MQGDWQVQRGDESIGCGIGIMAHNEEANIGRTIRAAAQHDTEPSIEGIVVDKESSNDMDGDKIV